MLNCSVCTEFHSLLIQWVVSHLTWQLSNSLATPRSVSFRYLLGLSSRIIESRLTLTIFVVSKWQPRSSTFVFTVTCALHAITVTMSVVWIQPSEGNHLRCISRITALAFGEHCSLKPYRGLPLNIGFWFLEDTIACNWFWSQLESNESDWNKVILGFGTSIEDMVALSMIVCPQSNNCGLTFWWKLGFFVVEGHR